MHPFHDYLAQHLEQRVRKRSIVVFYDPRNEFRPFFEQELAVEDADPLPRTTIAGRSVFLARHRGSLFALRVAVEPIVSAHKPSEGCSDEAGLHEVLSDHERGDDDATAELGEEVLVGVGDLLDEAVGAQALDQVGSAVTGN